MPILLVLALLVLASRAAPASPAADDARGVIQDTIDQVTGLLRERTLPPAERRERITGVVEDRLDAVTLSKLVLAKNWNRLSEAQQGEFVREFRQHLVLTYYRNVDKRAFERIEIYDDRAEAKGDWTIRTKVLATDAGDVLIDYRLRRQGEQGPWRVIDILIEGVSLVSNFRSQFQEVLSDSQPEDLLRSLREKNAKAEAEYAEAEGRPVVPSEDPPREP